MGADHLSSWGWPKLTQNEIIYMYKEEEKMFYEIYLIKRYF